VVLVTVITCVLMGLAELRRRYDLGELLEDEEEQSKWGWDSDPEGTPPTPPPEPPFLFHTYLPQGEQPSS
jgi:hypothetical protein